MRLARLLAQVLPVALGLRQPPPALSRLPLDHTKANRTKVVRDQEWRWRPTPVPVPKDWCSRSQFIVRSREDELSGASKCSREHALGVREFHGTSVCRNDYGHYLERPVNGRKGKKKRNHTICYIEIPKVGSTGLKKLIAPMQISVRHPVYEGDARFVEAFTVVRHPVRRFLSGYGTVLRGLLDETPRLHSELEFLRDLAEPERFARFVSFFVKRGTGMMDLARTTPPCLMHHLFSQTWFLNLWPGQVDLVLHLESLHENLRRLNAFLSTDFKELPHRNEHQSPNGESIDLDLLAEQKVPMQQLHDYFRLDMARFGYKPLPGFH